MGCAGVGVPFVHLELVGRGGLGRRLLDRLRELEVVVVDACGSKDDVYRAMFLEDDD